MSAEVKVKERPLKVKPEKAGDGECKLRIEPHLSVLIISPEPFLPRGGGFYP
jgi:hypothetical protein